MINTRQDFVVVVVAKLRFNYVDRFIGLFNVYISRQIFVFSMNTYMKVE